MAKNNSAAGVERSISSTPATMSSSSLIVPSTQSTLVLDSTDMGNMSFEEYLVMANGGVNAGNGGAPGFETPNTLMTGTEVSSPANEVDSFETRSSTLRKKLLAARTTTPTSNFKSASVSQGYVADRIVTPATDINFEKLAVVPAVEDLISRYPEFINATSKADVIHTIVHSNVVNTKFDLDDASTYPIDYAQFESLADEILARSNIAIKGPAEEKQAVLDNFDFGEKDSDVENDDPVTNQEEKVLLLRTVLAEKLNACFPVDSSADSFTSAEDQEAAFREQATSLEFSMFFDRSLSTEDGELLKELSELDGEVKALRLLKEAAENAKADENALTEKEETLEEIHRRNMNFLAQETPMPTMLFDENYVEQDSNDEDMAKIGHMLNPSGPLYQEYHRKKELKHKDFLKEEMARRKAQWMVDRAAMVQRDAAMSAAEAAGQIVHKAPEDDFFFTFGK
ncbi:hypothetical protein IFR05_009012 [Cadophora sp. M221]|nr:hypothetical protein IFR05_009012 [Cadophora sp. M221]